MSVSLTIPVEYGARKTTKARQSKVQLGDGYVQVTGDGINATKEVWAVTVPKATSSDIDAIESTLASAVGDRLSWTAPTPGATAKEYLCPDEWDRQFHSHDVESLSFTLEEAF